MKEASNRASCLQLNGKENVKRTERSTDEKLKAFQQIDTKGSGREEVLDMFILSLEESDLDSEEVARYARGKAGLTFLLLGSGILLILFALAVILFPLLGYLEVATLYYFNPNDGITVSDVLAVVMLLCGIYLCVWGIALRRSLRGS